MIEVGEAPPHNYRWISTRANIALSDGFRALQAIENGKIIGMVGYDGWTPNSCCMHVAIEVPMAIRKMRKPAFEVPFQVFNKNIVFAPCLSDNQPALRFISKLGFRLVSRLIDAWKPGVDMMLFEMRRENCRWLEG